MQTSLNLILLSGKDPNQFIQRLITQDINTCDKPKLSALCTPYGKVSFIFWIQLTHPNVSIWIDQHLAAGLKKTLRFYDPFETIEITTNKQPKTSPLLYEDPWPLALIKNNILTLNTETQNRYTPHILTLDKHQALSFSKGCFIGYEPIARTQQRGKIKRSLRYSTAIELPENALNHYKEDNLYHYLSIEPIAV